MSTCEGISKMTKQEIIQGYIDVNKSQIKTEEISDGHHTFGELYYHRAVLFSVICNTFKEKSWKSKVHSDGAAPFGDPDMFIVGVDTAEGQYTYHYHMEYWDLFRCDELILGKEWDGHKPEDVTRLLSIPHE